MDSKKKDIQIKEERGLWKASSYIHNLARRFRKRKQPIGIRYILEAHKILFSQTGEGSEGGKYRKDNPEVIRIDNTLLPIPHWTKVGFEMAILNEELKNKTSSLRIFPRNKKDYVKIIDLAAKTSHRLASIHPFHNGNGRMSRLLINFILWSGGLSAPSIKEDKKEYLQAMRQGDDSDFGPLRMLIIKGLIRTHKKKVQRQRALVVQKKRKQKRIVFRKSDFK